MPIDGMLSQSVAAATIVKARAESNQMLGNFG
jgi:hypothetical protein